MAFQNLYIHIPFCKKKCGYCSFYSETAFSEQDISLFLTKIFQQIEQYRERISPLNSIFIGGGTPTLLPNESLEKLLAFLTNTLPLKEHCELSIECNPETLTSSKIEIMSRYITRISLGIQAFNPILRKQLQRCGKLENLNEKLYQLRQVGITNIGFDLIYGIPGEMLQQWDEELHTALSFSPSHISTYALTIDEGCKLAKQMEIPPEVEDLSADMWEQTKKILETQKMMQYEISNYAIAGKECQHNQNIWHGKSYLGLGPAACSFDGQKRWSECSNLSKWLQNEPVELDIIPSEKRAVEMLIMGLRTKRGWCEKEFKHMTGHSLSEYIEPFKRLQTMKLLRFDEQMCCPTDKGLLFWDTIAENLWK